MSTTPPATPFVASSDAPDTVADLIRRATTTQASDIHLQRQGAVAQVAFRLDGVLVPVGELPPGLTDRVFGRIKYLAHLKTYVDDLPQEGRLNPEAPHSTGDVRVSTYPTVTGEKMVLRLFTKRTTQDLDGLNLGTPATSALKQLLQQPSGLLLLTGPAGSGKTSTIYASLQTLAAAGRHVITVEDPVEQILPDVMQTEIHEAKGITFATAARHLLRQDPEVLALGEIRDEETAQIALRAALTGHLLISTLHAGSCRGVFDRLLLLGVDASSLGALNGLILNQRLLRRRCSTCRGEGCLECLNTGYRGRVPVVEWLALDEPVRRALHSGSLESLAPEVPLVVQAGRLVSSGMTDQREVQRVLGYES